MRRQLHVIIKQMEKIQKKEKRYSMRTLKAMESYGLNIADSVWSAYTLFRLFIDCYFKSTITFVVD